MAVTNMIKKLILLFVVLAVMPLCANTAFADDPVAYVDGFVTDDKTGALMPGLNVRVECITGTYAGQVSQTVQTTTYGYYTTQLTCDMGDTVEVTVSDDIGPVGSNTGTVDYVGNMVGSEVDVGVAHVNVGIPEFSAAIIPMLLTMLSFGLVGNRLF